jgi:hypothetical protein
VNLAEKQNQDQAYSDLKKELDRYLIIFTEKDNQLNLLKSKLSEQENSRLQASQLVIENDKLNNALVKAQEEIRNLRNANVQHISSRQLLESEK